jgi:hypothetical protein
MGVLCQIGTTKKKHPNKVFQTNDECNPHHKCNAQHVCNSVNTNNAVLPKYEAYRQTQHLNATLQFATCFDSSEPSPDEF